MGSELDKKTELSTVKTNISTVVLAIQSALDGMTYGNTE